MKKPICKTCLEIWKKCCKKEIKRVWDIAGDPMQVIHYTGTCPECKHFIGLTQTSKKEAEKFLR